MNALSSLPALAVALLCGCAPTVSVRLAPAPQSPVCQPDEHAQVFWTPQWRTDQKDVPAREAAAAEGIRRFFQQSGCFATARVERLAGPDTATVASRVAALPAASPVAQVLVVRELGPTLKIGSSLALVEGATEVVLEVAEYRAGRVEPRQFSVVWRAGGPGTIKGVATLPEDMQSALAAGLQPAAR